MIAHDIARKMAVYGQLPAKHVVSVLDDLGQTFAQHGFVKKLVHIGVRSGVMWCPKATLFGCVGNVTQKHDRVEQNFTKSSVDITMLTNNFSLFLMDTFLLSNIHLLANKAITNIQNCIELHVWNRLQTTCDLTMCDFDSLFLCPDKGSSRSSPKRRWLGLCCYGQWSMLAHHKASPFWAQVVFTAFSFRRAAPKT